MLPGVLLPGSPGFATVAAQELTDHAGQQVAQSGRTG
ncbi:hypothetical protein BJ971_006097 [Actinoplanes digitatis]|uniref:Uncharacterized protein n=1 Tax=Actinoplanes digitatis TaxID=1868 RepID=A0A7W7I3D8_9ACTN|nr:hypothetical protein [Actinoplanes digitatis]